ncbi:hypothetical protein ACH415_21080 [Streptomyces californicus]|uniref:hypothetical protein n=1 Tax=Streptomyces californicus TaxID=67351 RepID=UPI00379B10ED
MTTISATRTAGRPLLDSRVLVRTYAATLVVNLPLLALLLVPQLLRSRAGSEALLTVGSFLLLVLVTSAVVIAPEVSARVAPAGDHWRPGRARSRTRAMLRSDRRASLRSLAEFVGLYIAAQGVGGVFVWMMPYVWANPAHEADPAQSAWVIDYPNYATQAAAIYLCVCFAVAWYATRVRARSARLEAAA